MHRTIIALIVIFTSTFPAGAQDKNAPQPDSSNNHHVAIELESIKVKLPAMLPLSLGMNPRNFAEFFHQTPILSTPFFLPTKEEGIDLITPWKDELKRQDELKTLRTILGSVEVGGAAYVAYRHLKKYGLK